MPPYTSDRILGTFKFCNIYRELDRQTLEYHTMLLPFRRDFPLWLLNMFYCRLICNPATVRDVGLLSFDIIANRRVYERLVTHLSPKYGNAYVFPISTLLRSEYPSREEFLCFYVPKVIEACADELVSHRNASVDALLQRVLAVFKFKHSFLWTEVLIDVAYQYPDIVDLYQIFPIGPGAIRTMKQLNGDALPKEVCLALTAQSSNHLPLLSIKGRPAHLSAENWEGIGCEYRKYSNLKQGFGRRRRYHPH